MRRSFCFGVLIVFCLLGQARAAESVLAQVDKISYDLLEKIKVSLLNVSSLSVFSQMNEIPLVFEKKNAVGNWEEVQYRFICMPPDCKEDRMFMPPQEIKPNETLTIEWLPRVFADEMYNIPEDGVYRIKIAYGMQKQSSSLFAITPEFSIIDTRKGLISVSPLRKNSAAVQEIKVLPQDRDLNGVFEAMVFEANFAVEQSGLYIIEGLLYNNQDQIRDSRLKTILDRGTNALTFNFDLKNLPREFFPVTAFTMTVRGPDGRVFKRKWRDDRKFRPAQFEGGSGILFINEGIKDEITPDNDLKISGKVKVLKEGQYGIICSLFNPKDDVEQAKSLLSSSIDVDLSSGEREFSVLFNGTTLSLNKTRGPFKPVFSIRSKSGEWEDYSGDTGYITRSNTGSLVKTLVLGNFTSAILDNDKDEDLDTLAISFDLDIPREGQYFLLLPLEDKNNKTIAKSGRLSGSKANLAAGIDFKKGRTRVTVEYGWGAIVEHGEDGPYHFGLGEIMSVDAKIMDTISFATPAYKLSDYPGKGVKSIKIVDDYPEDLNRDGIFENLVAVAEVEMYEGGTFLSDYGRLENSNGHLISGLSRLKNIDLKPGKQTILLRFPGTDINKERADGPYLIHFSIETEGFGRILDVSCTNGSGGKLNYQNCTDGKERRRDWTLINYKTKPYSYKSFFSAQKR